MSRAEPSSLRGTSYTNTTSETWVRSARILCLFVTVHKRPQRAGLFVLYIQLLHYEFTGRCVTMVQPRLRRSRKPIVIRREEERLTRVGVGGGGGEDARQGDRVQRAALLSADADADLNRSTFVVLA